MKSFKSRFAAIKETLSYKVEELKLDFTIKLNKVMCEQNINQSQLAEKLGSSKSYTTKLLKGDCNVSIATMVKIAEALDSKVEIHIAPKKATIRWFEVYETKEKIDTTKAVKNFIKALNVNNTPKENYHEFKKGVTYENRTIPA